MAKFNCDLWDSHEKVSSKDQLLVATLLWLRSYDRNAGHWLGLQNLIKLLVPYDKDMKLGLGVPELPADHIIASNGVVTYAPGVSNSVRFVYVSANFTRELDLDRYGSLHISYVVHIRWLEWALANAILMLHKAGKPWLREHTALAPTIGGIEIAEFLK